MNTSVLPSSIRTGMETTIDRLGSIIRSATPSSSSVSRATVRNCWHAIRYVGELMNGSDAGLAGGIAVIHAPLVSPRAAPRLLSQSRLHAGEGEEPSGGTTGLYVTGHWSLVISPSSFVFRCRA